MPSQILLKNPRDRNTISNLMNALKQDELAHHKAEGFELMAEINSHVCFILFTNQIDSSSYHR